MHSAQASNARFSSVVGGQPQGGQRSMLDSHNLPCAESKSAGRLILDPDLIIIQ
jgi:hypothetical protein